MSWGADNAEAELDLLEAEHRAVLEAAVTRAKEAVAAEEGVADGGIGTGTAVGGVVGESTAVGTGAQPQARAASSNPGSGPRVESIGSAVAPANPTVPSSLFGLAVGWHHLGAGVGLRNWNSQDNGFELGMSFLGSSANGVTALMVGGNAGFMISLAAAHDARLFLEPEVGLTLFAAEGLDSAAGFYGALGFGVEYLIARRGLPVMGLHAKVLSGFERLAAVEASPGPSATPTSFGFLGGAVGVAAYFNKP
jgi:hypothetical protein